MLDKSSFRTIRSYGGSQQGGFEELICQLAHLDPPTNSKSFVRKEGAGGDAGVECFWILNDGTEHAWQAKYFLDEMTSDRWNQVSKSVKTAIEKHPRLSKYYVCIPHDRTDIRRKGRSGKQTVSLLDDWNENVEKWEEFAKKRNVSLEFVYWGAHEILLRLQQDDPKYSGRALYWFNEPLLSTNQLKQCLNKQEKNLGERYTPEFHVDLPIAKSLEGLLNNDKFWNSFNREALEWDYKRKTFLSANPHTELIESYNEIKLVLDNCRNLVESVNTSRDRKKLLELQQVVMKTQQQLNGFRNVCYFFEQKANKPREHGSTYQDEVWHFNNNMHNGLCVFVNSDFFNSNVTSALLITGEAGAGKSHLLCDFAKKLIQDAYPAVLILGQHYRGGEPLRELQEVLDLNPHPYQTVLGAIDAAGEAARMNSIILIDAINEGDYRNQWKERIAGLLEDIKRFPHIALVISCRTLFVDRLIPKRLIPNEIFQVTHEGFKGHEHKAASIILANHGISKPTAPVIAPEFSNPLFVITCAKALKQLGKRSWPKGYQGRSQIFKMYIDSLEETVSIKRNTERNDKICQKSLEAVAIAMFPDNLFGLPWDDTQKIINAIDTAAKPDETLLQTLLREGALAQDIKYNYDVDGENEDIVRFTFERFCDQFIAQSLLVNIQDPRQIFDEDLPLGKAIKDKNLWSYNGILESLAIIVPEKYGIEFWNIFPDNYKSHPESADVYFFNTLPFRSPKSFTTKTLELFDSLHSFEHGFYDKRLSLLIQFATEPNHPWNAEFLHDLLIRMSMPERDAWWSTFVAKNDFEEEDDQPESIIRSIIEWATFGDLQYVEKQQASLTLMTLIWFTTTTNRKTRDQATKAAARLFACFPELVVTIVTKFKDVDDLYLQERLYASAYGGLCNTSNDEQISSAAKCVYNIQFADSSPTEHLMIRDYARGIMELAHSRNLLEETVGIEKCRPPYKSAWPLDYPREDEFDPWGSKIERSIFHDDFGNYTMKSVTDFSPTSITEPDAESQKEILNRLVKQLDKKSKGLFDKAVKAHKAAFNNTLRYFQSQFEEQNDHLEEPENGDAVWNEFYESLNVTLKNKFQSIKSYVGNGNIKASFDEEIAKRWVCKHAIKLGWTKELFEEFEETLPYDGRGRPSVERIGKKYQRIAYHVFLAHLADNVHYKEDYGYSDTLEPSRYRGPWQLRERDIDPTNWMRKTCRTEWSEENSKVWWRPIDYKYKICADVDKESWCKNPLDLPKFEDYLRVSDKSNNYWYSLRGYSSWDEKEISGDSSSFKRSIWFRINPLIIYHKDLSDFQCEMENEDFISPDIIPSVSTHHQIYLREYPWHLSAQIQDQFIANEREEIKTPHIIPCAEYEWEKSDHDLSIESSISFYMPSSILIDRMSLKLDQDRFGSWINRENKIAFFDPSIENEGPSYALVECNSVNQMLVENNLVLVWLIGGEKIILNKSNFSINLNSKMVFNSMLWTNGDSEIHSTSRHYME